jgi:hypothetical protein
MERTALVPERGEPEVERSHEAVECLRRPGDAHVILEYRDHERPYSWQKYREI